MTEIVLEQLQLESKSYKIEHLDHTVIYSLKGRTNIHDRGTQDFMIYRKKWLHAATK